MFLAIGVAITPLPARSADTIDELARGAVFTFAICSDNHGATPDVLWASDGRSVRMDRMDWWQRTLGSRFIIGDGDHVQRPTDPFFAFMQNDPFWHTQFYPGAGDWDNKACGGSESAWCTGGCIFEYTDLRTRSWVQVRPAAPEYPPGCDYYAQIPVQGWTVHLIHVHYPDSPSDPNLAFRPESRQFLVDTLNSITRGPKDIVIATAHTGTQANGHWISVLSSDMQQTVMQKCDLAIAASTHRYQRYIHPSYGVSGGCLCLNSGCISGSAPDNMYIQCFVFDNPARLVTVRQRIDDAAAPQLRTDVFNGAYSSYVKLVGQLSNSISWVDSADSWDSQPAGAASPEGTFLSGWNLVAIPLDPSDPGAESVLGGLSSGANSLANNLIRYQPGIGYQIFPSDFTELEAGRGYWVRLQEPGSAGFVGNSRGAPAYIQLAEGWSLIGLPRTWPVFLGQTLVKRGSDSPVTWYNAVQLGWVGAALYYYEDGAYKTLRTSGGTDNSFRPWKAYWIKTTRSDLSIGIPAGVEPTPVVHIDNVRVIGVGRTTATIAWDTPVFSTSRVDFGRTPSYGESTGTDTAITRSHSMIIAALAPGTEYHYRVTSTDTPAVGTSQDAVFTTSASATLPADSGFESGGLTDWVEWPSGTSMMQVGGYSAVGKIYPHSGSMFAYTKWAQVDQNGGLYARVGAVQGATYEASVWSNLYAVSSPAVPTGDCRSRVGIDPMGGRDPRSASIVWSAWDQRANGAPQQWQRLTAQAQAQSDHVSIFLEFDQKAQPQYYQMVNAFDDAAVAQLAP